MAEFLGEEMDDDEFSYLEPQVKKSRKKIQEVSSQTFIKQ